MAALRGLVIGSLACAGALVVGCESFSSTSPDDGTNDAGASDGAANEGGADAAGDSNVEREWTPLFEESFSNGIALWSTVVTGTGVCSPTANQELRVLTGSTPSIAYLARQPPTAISYEELRVDFRVFPLTFGTLFPCVVTLQPGAGQRPSLRLQPTPPPGMPALHHEHVQVGFDDHAYAGQLPVAMWTAVRIEVRVGASSHAKVSYNGTTVLDIDLKEPFPALERPQLGIGLTCDQANGDFMFDDVAVFTR